MDEWVNLSQRDYGSKSREESFFEKGEIDMTRNEKIVDLKQVEQEGFW